MACSHTTLQNSVPHDRRSTLGISLLHKHSILTNCMSGPDRDKPPPVGQRASPFVGAASTAIECFNKA